MAVGWAEVLGAHAVFFGAVSADSSGYPDCRPSFVEAFIALVPEGTRPGRGIRVIAPLVDMTKAQIVRAGIDAGVDFSLTVSCYQADAEGRACGRCDSCRIRRSGFEAAGIADPTRYVTAAPS
jgi:7-cyano-7-deazaguanine synthase